MDLIKPYMKAAVAVAIAGLTAVYAVVTDGISADEWTYVGGEVLAAVLVWLVPNKPVPPAV